MIRSISLFFGLALLTDIGLALGVEQENWVQWRGPTADGVAGSEARPPLNSTVVGQ